MALLEIKDLRTSFFTDKGEIKALRGISFNLEKGKILGIVGESGSGKSITAYSILNILPKSAKVVGGSIKLDGEELVGAKENKLQQIRGNKISIVFQDPMTSLNPTYTIGYQLTEAIILHTKRNKKEAQKRAAQMLTLVNVNEPQKRLKQYPFELSGGMRQRVMIAMALACEPDILIADEPTTALDVTIQADILDLLISLQKKIGMSVIMITHDLGVIAKTCDEVIVMYAGTICEKGTVDDIFYNPSHEYTKGLLRSVPKENDIGKRLNTIDGTVINLSEVDDGGPFAPRCREAMNICVEKNADTFKISKTHEARCWVNQRQEYLKRTEPRNDA